jgi:hypothetical protein
LKDAVAPFSWLIPLAGVFLFLAASVTMVPRVAEPVV